MLQWTMSEGRVVSFATVELSDAVEMDVGSSGGGWWRWDAGCFYLPVNCEE